MTRFAPVAARSACLALVLAAGGVFAQGEVKPGSAPAQTAPNLSTQAPASQATPAPAGASPKIEFQATSIDNGKIPDDKEVEQSFKFKNSGTSDLELQQPQGSCGCTVPSLEKLVYKPGESGEIKVKYNPHNRNGKQHTTVTVRSNDPTNPSQVLDVHSDIRPLIRVEPMMVNLGQVGRDQGAKATVTINNRMKDVKITQVTPSSPKILAKILETKMADVDGEQVEQTVIELSLDPKATTGQINENITIRTTDASRVLSSVVMGEVMGNIQANPNQLQFAGLVQGQPINNALKLTSRNGKPFKIVSVEETPIGGDKIFTFTPTEDTSKTPSEWTIAIAGTAPGRAGAIRGEIVVTTDSVDEPQMRVRYFGFTRASAAQQPAQPSAWDQHPSSLVPGGN
jgi:hypothetical protein